MGLNRTNLKRLASLSAVGAGAFALTADKAEASVIYSGPTSVQVGFTAGALAWKPFNLPGSSAAFSFTRTQTSTGGLHSSKWHRGIHAYATGMVFQNLHHVLQVFDAGAIWGVNPPTGRSSLGGRNWTRTWSTFFNGSTNIRSSSTFHHLTGNGAFTDKYLLFVTTASNYGWVELSYDVTNAFGGAQSFGPTVTIEGYAYDNTGAKIAAGDTVAAVPEPGTLFTTGLAALALGAAGWRRKKAAA